MRPGKRSLTAQYVAFARAVMADRGVVDDPHAEALLDPMMTVAHRLSRYLPRQYWSRSVMLAALSARTLWFDAQVTDALDAGVPQLAIIGAGYDSRAWRLRRRGVRWFELDHPATQADKVRRSPPDGPTYVACDLTAGSAAAALVARGLDGSAPALFVLEGLTMYLDEATLQRQLADLAEASAPGSRLALNFAPPRGVGTVRNRRMRWLLSLGARASGESPGLKVDGRGAVRLIEGSGWEVTEETGLRDAAYRLVPERAALPVRLVEAAAPLVAAVRR